MIRLIIQRVFRLALAVLFLFLSGHTWAQDKIQERTVEHRKVFRTNISYSDTFKTAKEGCVHWGKERLPNGYTYHSHNMFENGSVQCIFKKPGSADNDQGGQVWGVIVCPENASSFSKNNDNNFNELICLCNEGYKAKGKVCEKDTCAEYEKMSEDGLREWARARLQRICDEENEAFKNDPKKGGSLLTDKEVKGFSDEKGGWKTSANGNETYADWVWRIKYGQIIEKMIAKRLEKETCLKDYLVYVPGSQQMKESGPNPDFKGKGKLPAENEYDITTPEQVIVKSKNPLKAHFIFITYTRLFTSDELVDGMGTNPSTPGNTNLPKPPKNQTPAKPPIKPPKPPKSSTDG
ncbi:MAG: hypothetical protein JNM68_02260 [Dinghuibacter sp.]|nr:hypothetical protein [Dinghuibacter sp.]